MRPRSETFDAAAASDHLVYATATLTTADGDVLDLPVGEGSQVTLDGNAATRAALNLNVPLDDFGSDDWIPDGRDDPLAPFGNEIAIRRGMITADGVEEVVQLGVFRIDESDVTESDDGSLDLTVSGLDRSSRIIDAVFEQADTVDEGANALDTVQALIGEADPSIAFDFVTSAVTLPYLGYEAGDDRWDFCLGCAEAAQCSLYFDGDGVLVARPLPVAVSADLVVAEGEGGILLGADKRMSREDATNRVTVQGENSSGDPAWGEAIDDDPESPTYYYGAFGKTTFSYSSEYVTADDQAASVAARILEMRRGITKQVTFAALANPALEPFDTVQVTRAKLGIDELHIVDSLTIPLDYSGRMDCVTRAVALR